MATQQAVRRWILTIGITAITITGSVYGANLKSEYQVHQKRKKALQSSPEEMIPQLEAARTELVGKKNELERKIAAFRKKQQEKKENIEPEHKGR